jgi:hypothetical protein
MYTSKWNAKIAAAARDLCRNSRDIRGKLGIFQITVSLVIYDNQLHPCHYCRADVSTLPFFTDDILWKFASRRCRWALRKPVCRYTKSVLCSKVSSTIPHRLAWRDTFPVWEIWDKVFYGLNVCARFVGKIVMGTRRLPDSFASQWRSIFLNVSSGFARCCVFNYEAEFVRSESCSRQTLS